MGGENDRMKEHNLMYRFEQMAGEQSERNLLYVYDDVSANGKFDWNTWEYKESETSAKYFRDKLDQIPNGQTIELHVNSRGGDVGEGVTIYNLLKKKSNDGCKVIGYVDGYAYSVAMVIMMACDEIHMGYGTSMLIHNPWACVSGNASDLRSMADQLDALSASSRQLFMSRCKNLTEEQLKEMMDKETMLAPDDCLKYGFCDFVGEADPLKDPDDDTDDPDERLKNKLNQLNELIFKQKQINEMLDGLTKKPVQSQMSATMKKAVEILSK